MSTIQVCVCVCACVRVCMCECVGGMDNGDGASQEGTRASKEGGRGTAAVMIGRGLLAHLERHRIFRAYRLAAAADDVLDVFRSNAAHSNAATQQRSNAATQQRLRPDRQAAMQKAAEATPG